MGSGKGRARFLRFAVPGIAVNHGSFVCSEPLRPDKPSRVDCDEGFSQSVAHRG